MASRRVAPAFEGRTVQAPGMMRRGSYPVLDAGVGHHSLESLPSSKLLEKKVVVQEAEMECLTRENQRLAATHVTWRQELVAMQQEMQSLQARIGSIETESGIQIRILLEKIAKMEDDIRAGESVKKDLLEARKEVQSLIEARQDLTTQIQLSTQDLQKAHADVKQLPELHAELNNLEQEHQRLRVAFEYEKSLNMEQVEQLHAMEKNLLSMAREVEKLHAEVLNADRRARASRALTGTHANSDPSYPPQGEGSGSYPDANGRPSC
ncbi:hypothetical protein Scep_025365 [Stephania cephalantha]|uniref:Uncharacterized protein n=1 Tax=Stephania cephalantha TaxID=152367 RepID=A0AAP0EI43_9MAGN